MGNQVSKRRKVPDDKSASTSMRNNSDSLNNGSSLSSQVPKFAQEIFPHTTTEASRQQGEHYLFKHVFQKSHFAPVDEILSNPDSQILDIGCGSNASWVLDMANDFPNCIFSGFDIIQPFSLEADVDSIGHIPVNCRLVKLDVFDGLPYQNKSFDFVHQRMMQLVYPSNKISWMFGEILRLTKDNGWIELVELDTTPKRAGPIFARVFIAVKSLLTDRLGRFLDGSAIAKKMDQCGLLDITTDYGSAPVCWGGYVGKLVYEDMLVWFKHLGPSVYEYLELGGEYNEEVYDALLDSAFDECVEYQTYMNIRWVYGRKPASS